LVFSDARLSAIPKLNAAGQSEANKYVVTIAGQVLAAFALRE